MYIVCKLMDIYGYPDIRRIWIWDDTHAHEYLHGRGTLRLVDMDIILVCPSKLTSLPSLIPCIAQYDNIVFSVPHAGHLLGVGVSSFG
jgi:hypothetical protein